MPVMKDRHELRLQFWVDFQYKTEVAGLLIHLLLRDYVVLAFVTLFNLLSWFTIVENDCEIADVSVPDAKLNTTATSSATNAKMAPYSVIPCPDSSEIKLLNEVAKFMDLPPGLKFRKSYTQMHIG